MTDFDELIKTICRAYRDNNLYAALLWTQELVALLNRKFVTKNYSETKNGQTEADKNRPDEA